MLQTFLVHPLISITSTGPASGAPNHIRGTRTVSDAHHASHTLLFKHSLKNTDIIFSLWRARIFSKWRHFIVNRTCLSYSTYLPVWYATVTCITSIIMTYVHCSKWRHTISNSNHYHCMQHVISMAKEHIIFDSVNTVKLSSITFNLSFYVCAQDNVSLSLYVSMNLWHISRGKFDVL